ncbi:hypothetical protein [Tepidibacter hydrothermalis]|uniref:Phage protein n=1 Tax=Tepidibacter hydrothermalis TaxID=3036126 RepID=A0ABY8E753_9FIRM|nr:hypothetical protein [Tepidibacter hydrothermalis]WFD08679.1 hypothetical protein P4S50_09720 [Tepidibacter hydrothermalis]
MIEFKKNFTNQLKLLENIRHKDIFENRDIKYSKWGVSIENINIIVFGDENLPNCEYIDMADKILKDLDKYKKLAIDRCKIWLGYDDLQECISMEFGQIYYSDIRVWENCFSLTFSRVRDIDSEWNYTVKFKDNGWPIGIEVWSIKRYDELEKSHYFIDFNEDVEDDINIECNNKKLQEDLMKFFKEHIKIEAEYDIDETICSCYCGTKKTDGCFYATGICQNTGDIIKDVYSNYTVKYVNDNRFIPIGIEFWIS